MLFAATLTITIKRSWNRELIKQLEDDFVRRNLSKLEITPYSLKIIIGSANVLLEIKKQIQYRCSKMTQLLKGAPSYPRNISLFLLSVIDYLSNYKLFEGTT